MLEQLDVAPNAASEMATPLPAVAISDSVSSDTPLIAMTPACLSEVVVCGGSARGLLQPLAVGHCQQPKDLMFAPKIESCSVCGAGVPPGFAHMCLHGNAKRSSCIP